MSRKNIGWLLIAVGVFMLFKMVRVLSFGFYRIGGVDSSAIILILLIISAVAAVVNPGKLTTYCLLGCVGMLILSLLLGTKLYFAYTSLIDLLLVFIPIVFGTGLLIKG